MSRLHHRFPCHNTAATMFDRWSGLYLSLSILFSLIQVHVYFFGPIWSQNSADAFRGFLAKCNLSFSFLSSLPSARAFKVFDNHTPASLREYTLCVWLDVVKLSFSTSLCTLAVFCGLLGLLMLLKWPVFFLAKAAGGLLIWTLKTSLW